MPIVTGEASTQDSDAIIAMAMTLERQVRAVRESTAQVAHLKKMYDRASSLAKLGVWECDFATSGVTWTDGVYDLFEMPRGTPVNRESALQLYEDESRVRMMQALDQAIQSCGSFTIEVSVRTMTGARRWLRLTVDIEYEHGRPVRSFGVKQDITREVELQQQLAELSRSVDQVSARPMPAMHAATLG